MTYSVKAWHDYHQQPTVFQVTDEDDCEVARFPSEVEAIGKAAALETEDRFFVELGTVARSEMAGIFAKYRDYFDSLPPLQRERLLVERTQDVIAENSREE
jgi:hypothetical protein